MPSKKNFSIVKESIERLDFIGIQEYYNESIERFNKLYKFDIKVVIKENVSNLNIYSELTLRSRSEISKYMGKDLFTYSAALKIFERNR